ncbi:MULTISPECIES: COQ9 family protein [Sediminimonas]|uniref:COQ9 family protein n=1 Tax=Sediminimonas qiaohouensis TaxID=552061 RepID=A0A7C9M7W9_9RHOB|nr:MULTISPECIES: COQ9 family protein [Sediminimonas]MDR9483793.1 COQ9 family protein [Sediminimonas sp.]MTJ03881.1 COQ9 family protein [Sediminimonas qiaohouensis]
MTETSEKLLDAALMHVPFDGWTEATFRAAVTDTGTDMGTARALFPRGGVDMALAYHRRGDALMVERLVATDLESMRFRDRIAFAVRARIEAADDKEAVRRGSALFALPQYVPDGARAIWNTCDLIWTTLGDGSDDFNWYSKRATLSGVYSATVLYWLGDDSPGSEATWAFLDRRIENVMSIEKFKGKFRDSPFGRTIGKGPFALLDRIRAPDQTLRRNMPGSTRH